MSSKPASCQPEVSYLEAVDFVDYAEAYDLEKIVEPVFGEPLFEEPEFEEPEFEELPVDSMGNSVAHMAVGHNEN